MNALMADILLWTIVIVPSLSLTVWFVVSLILFLKTAKDSVKRKGRLIRMIVSGALSLTVIATTLTIVILFLIAIANM